MSDTTHELTRSGLNAMAVDVGTEAGPGATTKEFNRALIDAFRANRGVVPGELQGASFLLLNQNLGYTFGVTATVPLFLLLFAWAYFTMANNNPANFNIHPLTRTDALYFTVTVFSTVGFGDIVAVSQPARLVVTVQMLLDLLVLGLVVRAFVGAVQFARQQAAPANGPGGPPGQSR